MKNHQYKITVEWTGNKGSGTSSYKAYDRDHLVFAKGKTPIQCSSDPAFRGDPSRYNPEEQLVAALSSCHMLWYLHLCSSAGIIVTAYEDYAEGVMEETASGSGFFREVILKPNITITNLGRIEEAMQLHHKANEMCFIANSVNFPVKHEAVIQIEE